MRQIPLGRSGLVVSEVGFGCIPIIRLDPAEAVRVLRRAHESGITLYDTANAYSDSEDKIGQAFQGMRDEVVLATKTLKRNADGATAHLENSLRMLRTDYVDLFQLHQVAQEKDWEAVSGPGGALEALFKAREQGKIRCLGVTSHSLSMAVKLTRTGLFSTVQFPFNFIEDAAQTELHAAARERGVGILAMKPFAGGMIDNASISFKFLREHDDVVALPGFDAVGQVDEVVGFYDRPNVVTDEDRQLMDRYRADLGKQFCRRCEYCQPCPNGVMITAAMGYRVVAARMSPRVSVQFCGTAMESVSKCTDCEECVARCPYELPIPEMLKAHYDLYESHRAALTRPPA